MCSYKLFSAIIMLSPWMPTSVALGASDFYDLPVGSGDIHPRNWDCFVETNRLSILCIRALSSTNRLEYRNEILCAEIQNINTVPKMVMRPLGTYDKRIGGSFLINRTTGIYSVRTQDKAYRTFIVDFAGEEHETREISSLIDHVPVYNNVEYFGDKNRMTDTSDVFIPYYGGLLRFSGKEMSTVCNVTNYYDFACLSGGGVLFCENNFDIPCLIRRYSMCETRIAKHIAYERIPLPGKVRKLPRLQDGQQFAMAETADALLFFDRSKLYMTRDKGETWVTRDTCDEIGEAIPSAEAIVAEQKSGHFMTRRTPEAIYRGLFVNVESGINANSQEKKTESCQVYRKHVYIHEIRTSDGSNYFWRFPRLETEDSTFVTASSSYAMYPLPDRSWLFLFAGFNTLEDFDFHVIKCVGERISGTYLAGAPTGSNGCVAISRPVTSGMVAIPSGTNSGTDPDFGAYSLTVEAFFMDATEVTKAKWDEVYTWAVTNGYTFFTADSGKAADHPVHTVSWYDCVKWCNARSEKEGKMPCYTVGGNVYKSEEREPDCNFAAAGYRLPTDTEWEYAARGGLSGNRFPWGGIINHKRANYSSGGDQGFPAQYATGEYPYTSPVGAFAANGYGLFDMVGNVSEWCWNKKDSSRSNRGGSWCYNMNSVRIGSRSWNKPDYVDIYLGFRTVCR